VCLSFLVFVQNYWAPFLFSSSHRPLYRKIAAIQNDKRSDSFPPLYASSEVFVFYSGGISHFKKPLALFLVPSPSLLSTRQLEYFQLFVGMKSGPKRGPLWCFLVVILFFFFLRAFKQSFPPHTW